MVFDNAVFVDEAASMGNPRRTKFSGLPQYQQTLVVECVGRDDVSELHPGVWTELVRIAQVDADFRQACLALEFAAVSAPA